MRLPRTPAFAIAVAITSAVAIAIAGCGSSPTSTNSTGTSGSTTITYWASDQGSSIADDYTVLNPEIAKFTQQTGIKVNVEVIGWPDLLNRILAATTTGKGPDVVNIGNTWSASLQATGALLSWDSTAFSSIGGESRFVSSAIGSTGAAGKPPAAVPLYSLAYALYYNKALFQQAGISGPPATWDRADRRRAETHARRHLRPRARGRKHPGEHPPCVCLRAAAWMQLLRRVRQAAVHPARVRGGRTAVRQPDGRRPHRQPGRRAVRPEPVGLRLRLDGKVGMLMWQAAGANLKSHGMSASQYGVAPIPVQSGAPGQGDPGGLDGGRHQHRHLQEHEHLSAAEKFVNFMTSDTTQLTSTASTAPSRRSAPRCPTRSSAAQSCRY